MSTNARIQICLYDNEKVTVELRPHPDVDALMFSIDGKDAGFCLSGPPDRVREALAAIAAVCAEKASSASPAQPTPEFPEAQS